MNTKKVIIMNAKLYTEQIKYSMMILYTPYLQVHQQPDSPGEGLDGSSSATHRAPTTESHGDLSLGAHGGRVDAESRGHPLEATHQGGQMAQTTGL